MNLVFAGQQTHDRSSSEQLNQDENPAIGEGLVPDSTDVVKQNSDDKQASYKDLSIFNHSSSSDGSNYGSRIAQEPQKSRLKIFKDMTSEANEDNSELDDQLIPFYSVQNILSEMRQGRK